MGTRNVSTTMERKSTDNYGSLPFGEWYSKNRKVQLMTFKDAVNESEMVINALQGATALLVIRSCNKPDFDNKIVKTLNTMWSSLMVNPTIIINGEHQNYICGNDKEAKEKVITLLLSFGWSKDNRTESTLLIWTRMKQNAHYFVNSILR